MNLDRFTLDEYRLEGLNTKTVKRRSAVQKYVVVFGDLFKNVPNLFAVSLNQFFGVLNVVGIAVADQTSDHERFEKFERHGFWQTALVEFEFRTDHDDGTAGVVH